MKEVGDSRNFVNPKTEAEKVKKILRYNKFVDEVNPILSTSMIKTKEVFWPKQQYTYLSDHRQREEYVNDFWKDDPTARRDPFRSQTFGGNPYDFYSSPYDNVIVLFNFVGPRTVYAGAVPPYGDNFTIVFQTGNRSMWSLDAREDFTTASPGRIASGAAEGFNTISSTTAFHPIVSASTGEGILQNSMYPYSNYARVSASSVGTGEYTPWLSYALPQYNRRIAGVIPSDTDHEYKFGDTKWEAGSQSGITLWSFPILFTSSMYSPYVS